MNLNELKTAASDCSLCDLYAGRIKPVFDKGNPNARIMICGMVPAKEENEQGMPFVGRAGKLLDKILNEVNLDLNNVYVTNLVKCFLAAGRKLDQDWIDSCLPFLISQISIIKHCVIVTLGADATNALLGLDPETFIGQNRGKAHSYGLNTVVVPTYHPSFLLRQGGEASKHYNKVLDDFLLARDFLC
jgi:DNA polymerase